MLGVLSMRKSTEIIDDFIISLEKLIDTLDDEWAANKEGKWRQANDLRERVLPMAKEKFKTHFDEYLDRRFETFCEKNGIKRTRFSNTEEQ